MLRQCRGYICVIVMCISLCHIVEPRNGIRFDPFYPDLNIMLYVGERHLARPEDYIVTEFTRT